MNYKRRNAEAVQHAKEQILYLEGSKASPQHWHGGRAEDCEQRADELAPTLGEEHSSVIFLRKQAQDRQNDLEIALQEIEQRISLNRVIITEGGIF
jgi:D-lyxose ketol-isomerase